MHWCNLGYELCALGVNLAFRSCTDGTFAINTLVENLVFRTSTGVTLAIQMCTGGKLLGHALWCNLGFEFVHWWETLHFRTRTGVTLTMRMYTGIKFEI